jgi:hypothetical protein
MRNLYKPPRYNVASIQVQQTLGGDVMVADENGNYIEWRDYQWLLTEKQRLDSEVERWKEASENYRLMLQDRQAHLDAERKYVERLTKAGDKMAHIHRLTGFPSYTSEWEEEKGVQS